MKENKTFIAAPITEEQIFIGRRLKFLRDYNNMTCQQLSDALGLSKQAISKFECGELNPSNRVFNLICETFSISGAFFKSPDIIIQIKKNKIIILNDK